MAAPVEDVRRRQANGELAADIDPRAFPLAFMGAATVAVGMPQLVRSIYGAEADREGFTAEYADQVERIVAYLAANSGPVP